MSSEKIVNAGMLLELGLLLDNHGLEPNSDGPFAWCRRRFRLSTPPGAKFMSLAGHADILWMCRLNGGPLYRWK